MDDVFIASISNTLATEGAAYRYVVKAQDADGDTLSYSLSGTSLPSGLSIDPQTGIITWANPQGAPASIDITVEVSDNHGGWPLRSAPYRYRRLLPARHQRSPPVQGWT